MTIRRRTPTAAASGRPASLPVIAPATQPSVQRDARRRLALVGVGAGLLGGLLGVGGGVIIVPGLVWALGLNRHTATGTSLLAIVPIAVVGTATYALAPGGAFDLPASAVLTLGSLVGVIVGARGGARLSERALRSAFAVFTALLGARLVVPLGFGEGLDALPLDVPVVVLLAALGLAAGALAGLLGVGGSVIVIAVLVLAVDADQVLAQGVALAAVIPTVLVGAATHRQLGSLAPRAAVLVGAIGALTVVPGALLAFALSSDVLRTGFGAFLLLTSARTLRALRRSRAGS